MPDRLTVEGNEAGSETTVEVQLRSVHEHMLQLGLGALAHANWHAHFHSYDNEYWPQLSILQAAHAAEIFLKARIAQEHPLLIFEQFPRSTQVDEPLLSLAHLFEQGRTVQYAELPERLWATTGIRIANVDLYQQFGRLRNTIQHFAPPDNHDFSLEASRFIYGVVDLFMNQCWGLYAVDYCEDSAGNDYLIPTLVARGVPFLVPPDIGRADCNDFDWPNDRADYRVDMERRFLDALRVKEGADVSPNNDERLKLQ